MKDGQLFCVEEFSGNGKYKPLRAASGKEPMVSF
jgi:hypothetical protein